MKKTTLTLKEVKKSYRKHLVLDHINITLEPGIHGLIGPNGAGKSTLIRLLVGLEQPTSGTVLCNNQIIQQMGREYRALLGWMPQTQQGYGSFSGYAFLHYMARLKGVDRARADEQIMDLLKQVNLVEAMHRPLRTYSGGMRQRLMFAQAMLNHPKIVILDEPTAGLDPVERINLRNYIAATATDRIVLIATHVMQDIESIADQLVFLKAGQIITSGSVEQILEQLRGCVWEGDIAVSEYENFSQKNLVVRITKADNKVHIRYLSEQIQRDAVCVAPNLEDAYLFYLKGYGNAAG